MANHPSVLVLDDGELEDVSALLKELSINHIRVSGFEYRDAEDFPTRLLLTTPPHAMRLGSPHSWGLDFRPDPVRIVFVDRPTEMAYSTLRNCGCHYIVRRPFHPYALRLLVLAALHCGPEKRNHRRVVLGIDVGLLEGLRYRPATLADLSRTGCRLLTSFALRSGKPVNLRIPGSTTAGEPLSLRGLVLRCRRRFNQNQEDCFSAAVQFTSMNPGQAKALERLLAHYADQPISLEGPAVPAIDLEEAIPTIDLTDELPCDEVRPRAAGARPATSRTACSSPRPGNIHRYSSQLPRAPRCPFPVPVVTVSGARPSVIRAKNISVSGMLIEPRHDLNLGQRLDLELYTVNHGYPFQVPATVIRDDRPHGLALRFEHRDRNLTLNLEELVSHQLEIRGRFQA